MDLRQGIIFLLMSCYISAYAQNDQDNQEQSPNSDQYQEDEYIEGDDYSRMHLIEINLLLTNPTNALERNLDSKYVGFGLDYFSSAIK